MRVVFMGTPQFAVPSLSELARHHEVVAVYTRPDAISGRGGKTRPSPVKEAALSLHIPVLQPATLRESDAVASLADLSADILVVAAYGLILPPDVLEAASLGAINVHASLLPRWRGAAPIQRAILAGDSDTGVSIMRMEAGLDTGPYCLQRSTPIADKNAAELTAELAQIGAAALTEALPAIEDGSAHWVVQDEALVTYAQKVAKSDLLLLPELPTVDALRRIRSSMPAAPSRMRVADRGVTVVSAERSESTLAPGVVACSKRLLEAGFADGALTLTRVKPDGKAEMDGAAWARGIPDLNESSWGAPS